MGDSWAWAAHMYADEMYDEEQRRWIDEDEMGCDETFKPTEADDHMAAKYIKSTSQADVMRGQQRGKNISLSPIQFITPIVSKLNHEDGTVTLEFINIPNEQARRIVENVLPRVMELYLNKSKDYDGNVMALLKLGPKASFVDLWRKIGKLKGALWDEKPMVGEQADEILADCVGHILITLDEMNQEGQATARKEVAK